MTSFNTSLLILLHHYFDILLVGMLSYLFMSICTSQTYLCRNWYVINVHIFNLHQSNLILAGETFLFHLHLPYVLCHTLAHQWASNETQFIAFHGSCIVFQHKEVNHSWSWWGPLPPRTFLPHSFWIVFCRMHSCFWVFIFSFAE